MEVAFIEVGHRARLSGFAPSRIADKSFFIRRINAECRTPRFDFRLLKTPPAPPWQRLHRQNYYSVWKPTALATPSSINMNAESFKDILDYFGKLFAIFLLETSHARRNQ
jgi:hypothetical protein